MPKKAKVTELAGVALRLYMTGILVPDMVWFQGKALWCREQEGEKYSPYQLFSKYRPVRSCACGALVLAQLCLLDTPAATVRRVLLRPVPNLVRVLDHLDPHLLAEVEAAFELRPPSEHLGELPMDMFLHATSLWPHASQEERYVNIMSDLAKFGRIAGPGGRVQTCTLYVTCFWKKHGILQVTAATPCQGDTPLYPDKWFTTLCLRLELLTLGVDAFKTPEEARANVLKRIQDATHDGAEVHDTFRNYREALHLMLIHQLDEGYDWQAKHGELHPFESAQHAQLHRKYPRNPRWA